MHILPERRKEGHLRGESLHLSSGASPAGASQAGLRGERGCLPACPGVARCLAHSSRLAALGFSLGPALGEQDCFVPSSGSPAHGWDLGRHSGGLGILIRGRAGDCGKEMSVIGICLLPAWRAGSRLCAPGSAAAGPVGPGPGSIVRALGRWTGIDGSPVGGPGWDWLRMGSGRGLGLHPPDIPGLSYWEEVGYSWWEEYW